MVAIVVLLGGVMGQENLFDIRLALSSIAGGDFKPKYISMFQRNETSSEVVGQ